MNQIKDPQLHPYYIQIDEYNYSLFKTVTSTESGKDYDIAIGHFSNMGNCLKCIIKDSMRSIKVDTIKEYLTEYENVTNKINQIIKI
jgi:uncharacterized protein YutD